MPPDAVFVVLNVTLNKDDENEALNIPSQKTSVRSISLHIFMKEQIDFYARAIKIIPSLENLWVEGPFITKEESRVPVGEISKFFTGDLPFKILSIHCHRIFSSDIEALANATKNMPRLEQFYFTATAGDHYAIETLCKMIIQNMSGITNLKLAVNHVAEIDANRIASMVASLPRLKWLSIQCFRHLKDYISPYFKNSLEKALSLECIYLKTASLGCISWDKKSLCYEIIEFLCTLPSLKQAYLPMISTSARAYIVIGNYRKISLFKHAVCKQPLSVIYKMDIHFLRLLESKIVEHIKSRTSR
jgi:hypothetical protein